MELTRRTLLGGTMVVGGLATIGGLGPAAAEPISVGVLIPGFRQ